MTIEDWERGAAALVPILAILVAPIGAIVVANVTGRATRSAARIARDQDREADLRRRRVSAYQALAHACQQVVEAMQQYGDLYALIVEREQRYAGTHIENRVSETENRDKQVAKAEKKANKVWDAMPSNTELRVRLLDVELVGPQAVTDAARAYVELIIGSRQEIIDSGARSLLATGTLTSTTIDDRRATLYAAMLAATVYDSTEPEPSRIQAVLDAALSKPKQDTHRPSDSPAQER